MRSLGCYSIRPPFLALALALVGVPAVAQAQEPPSPAQCSSAYEESQRLGNKGKLQAAMEQLVVCAHASCPQFLAKECSSDYELMSRRIPTIVLRVVGADGAPVSDSRLSLDGVVVENAGGSLTLDPGLHEVAVARDGFRPATVRFVAAEGQKGQAVTVKLEPVPAPVAKSAPIVGPPPPPMIPPTSKGVPTASYVLGALGVAGLATGVAFRLVGSSSYDDLESRCGRACPPDDVKPVRAQFTVSSLGFGVGAAALLAAGVVLVVDSGKQSKTDTARAHWSMRALFTRSGAGAVFEGSLAD